MPCSCRAGTVRFRRLDPRDRAARLAHIDRLGAEARRARFLGGGPPQTLPQLNLAVGAFVGPRLIGLGELYALPDRTAAELALSVEPRFQNRGIGRRLLERLLVLARNRGFREVRTLCPVDNDSVGALMRRAGARIVHEPPEARGYQPLLPPTPATVLFEALDLGEFVRERFMLPAAPP